MLSGETRVRIFSTRSYNIGGVLLNGQEFQVRPGNMTMMTVDDVVFVSSMTPYFINGDLIIKDAYNKQVPLIDVGIYTEGVIVPPTEDEIANVLKGSPKKIESWFEQMREEGQNTKSLAMDVRTVAERLDMPASKIKLLAKYGIEVDVAEE